MCSVALEVRNPIGLSQAYAPRLALLSHKCFYATVFDESNDLDITALRPCRVQQ